MRIVVPFGFYGSGNIGDEATLQGFAALLQWMGESAQASVASRNPSHTARVEPAFGYFRTVGHDPRRWLAKLRADAHAIVGGTPIMDVLGDWPLCELTPLVQSVDRWKVPLGFVGIGTETLRSPQSVRIVRHEIVPRARCWSVRSEHDRERLIEYGASPEAIMVAADLAWLIDPSAAHFGRGQLREWGIDAADSRRLIGVNLVNENHVFDQQPRIAQQIAVALDAIVEKHEARVLFLANEIRDEEVFDLSAARRVMCRMSRADRAAIAPAVYFSPRQMMSIIACCDLTISMRYHFCLFSAIQGVPFVAIKRSDKVADLCWDLDWALSVLPAELEADILVAQLSRALGEPDETELLSELKCRVESMRRRARHNQWAIRLLSARGGVVAASRRPEVCVPD
ncbi:polysaccharide pyruvyl transferase family protein [Fontivita pretiosa]|uniref:polysaccharide pyruvyl transferase family protein n=1 Tax=Fontivita pretiosa TaxID=2989684 RepID=UPI003D16A473